jgi:uncharacterized membrane protein
MTIATPNDEVGPIGAEVEEFLEPAVTPSPPVSREEAGPDRGPQLQTTLLEASDRGFADVVAGGLARVAQAFPPSLTSALQGEWLGHPLHPALTDFPLGCWTSASLLDIVGGRSARPAATRLVALGLLGVPAAAAAGLADWQPIDGARARRVGATHAAANVVATACYLGSWRARRRGHHVVGVVTALAGAAVTLFSGYLGGELVFGVPERDG